MDGLDLTARVLNISPKATLKDVVIFFSYCGTIDEIKMSRQGDESQVAYVTFRQPYALETALLLNETMIFDRPIRILRLGRAKNIPISSFGADNQNTEAMREGGGILLEPQVAVQAIALKGQEVLNKARECVSGTGRTVSQQANLAISAAEQTVSSIGSAIMSRSCFSKSVLWLSGMLDKASKSLAELGDAKRKGTNSRKLK